MTDSVHIDRLCTAAGLTRSAVQRWLKECEKSIWTDPEFADDRGGWRRFSLESVVQFALAARLARAGASVDGALRVALAFVTLRSSKERDIGPDAAADIRLDADARVIGKPFREGRTWLAYLPSGDHRLIRVRGKAGPDVEDLEAVFEDEPDALLDGVFLLEVGPIYERAATIFGAEARDYRRAPKAEDPA